MAKLNANNLKYIILAATYSTVRATSFICDKHSSNQNFYAKLGSPGKVYFKAKGIFVFSV